MSLIDDAKQNMQLAGQVEELLKDARPDQRGSIYMLLMIYHARTLGIPKSRLLEMVGHFFDRPQHSEILN
jgi:hypothetical protein